MFSVSGKHTANTPEEPEMPTLYSASLTTPALGGTVLCGYCAECLEGYVCREGEPDDRLCIDCARAAAGVKDVVTTLAEALAPGDAEHAHLPVADRRAAAEFCIAFHLDVMLPNLDEIDRNLITVRVLRRLGLS